MKENLEEFAGRSSIHGVSYILDRTISTPDRVLWLLLLLGSIALSGYMITNTLIEWQEDPTITTLESNSSPVEGLPKIS